MPLDSIKMEVPDPLVTAWLDTSDLGNAKRLVQLAAGKLKWIEEAQAWAHYDGRRWSLERGNIEAQRIAQRVIEYIDEEARALGAIAEKPKELKEQVGDWCTPDIAQERVRVLRGHAVKSGSAGMTSGMLKQARSFLAALLEEFDTDPLAYNCLNGTLRFRQGPSTSSGQAGKWEVVHRPHDPADNLMQLAGVEYVPAADCPFWKERLGMLTPDQEQLDALKPLYGYTLTGLTSDQAFYVNQGVGNDGKSTTNQALGEMHGDYFRHAGIKTFLQGADRGGAEHRSDLVRLKGDIRFVTCDEPKARSVWDGEIIKQVTGSLVTARGSNERTEVTYRPRFKLFIECNNIPRAPSDDKGFRRRFKLFQWKVSLPGPGDEGYVPIDVALDRLRAEQSGILNWLIEGALQWLETRTIPQPSAMTAVLSEFWASSSPLLEWMAEWCDTSDPEARAPVKDLYAHFKEWCEGQGIEHIPSTTKFGNDLRDKQFPVVKDSRGVRWRKGLRLRTAAMFGDATPAPDPRAAPHLPANAVGGAGPAVDPDDDDDPLGRP